MTTRPTDQERQATRQLLELAAREDLGPTHCDLTSTILIPPDVQARMNVVANQPGVLAGLAFLPELLQAFRAGTVQPVFVANDGTRVQPGQLVATLAGSLCELLQVERTLLNLIGRLSGVATMTAHFVAAAGGKVAVYDTRKTTPGWRHPEKYAVRVGGGHNHRRGLYDAVLVKDNHRAWWYRSGRRLAELVRWVRNRSPAGTCVEVEVDNLEELRDVLEGEPDIVLLDNMDDQTVREAIALRNRLAPSIQLELSGGVTLQRMPQIAELGVDRVSVGALTHSATWLDFSASLA